VPQITISASRSGSIPEVIFSVAVNVEGRRSNCDLCVNFFVNVRLLCAGKRAFMCENRDLVIPTTLVGGNILVNFLAILSFLKSVEFECDMCKLLNFRLCDGERIKRETIKI